MYTLKGHEYSSKEMRCFYGRVSQIKYLLRRSQNAL
jgi:hypothetical protein